MTAWFIHSPLEQFKVVSFLSVNVPIFLYWNIALTNLGFYALITLALVIGIHTVGANNLRVVPSRWNISLEASYASLLSMVKNQIVRTRYTYPNFYALLWFVLLYNLNGNIAYGLTVTTSAVVCLGLSVAIFLGVTI